MKQGKTFMLFCWFLFPAKQKKNHGMFKWSVQVIYGRKLLYGKNRKKKYSQTIEPSVESPFYHSSGYFDK